jgi:hypothetical protein
MTGGNPDVANRNRSITNCAASTRVTYDTNPDHKRGWPWAGMERGGEADALARAWQGKRRQLGRGARGRGACAVRQRGAKELLTLAH